VHVVTVLSSSPEVNPVSGNAVLEPRIVGQSPANESTVVSFSDGTHKIFFINRPGKADRMMSLHSRDGIKWSEPTVEFELPGEAYYANRVVVSKSGTIYCVFHVWSTGDLGYRGRQLDLWYTRKNPNGQWAKPKKIFDGYVGSIRSFLELGNDRLILSFGKAVPERVAKPDAREVDYGWNEIVSLYTDDQGGTWKLSNSLKIEIDSDKTTRYGAVEPDVVELGPGKLWMLIRTNKGALYESFSEDSGSSWSDPHRSSFISSDSPPAFLRLRDGRLVLFFNMNQRWDNPNSYAFGGREALHAAISSDNGESWKGFREVMNVFCQNRLGGEKGDRGTAYPSSTETEDGKIILVTGQGVSRSILILDPDWLVKMDGMSMHACSNTDIDTADRLFHFAARRSGIVHMTMEIPEGVTGLRFDLTDHYTVLTDTSVNKNPVFRNHQELVVQPGFIELSIRWNIDQGCVGINLTDNQSISCDLNRDCEHGINYFRLQLVGGQNEQIYVPEGELIGKYWISNI